MEEEHLKLWESEISFTLECLKDRLYAQSSLDIGITEERKAEILFTFSEDMWDSLCSWIEKTGSNNSATESVSEKISKLEKAISSRGHFTMYTPSGEMLIAIVNSTTFFAFRHDFPGTDSLVVIPEYLIRKSFYYRLISDCQIDAMAGMMEEFSSLHLEELWEDAVVETERQRKVNTIILSEAEAVLANGKPEGVEYKIEDSYGGVHISFRGKDRKRSYYKLQLNGANVRDACAHLSDLAENKSLRNAYRVKSVRGTHL